MSLANFLYFSATGGELKTLSLVARQLQREGVRLKLRARTRIQLFDQLQVDEFIELAQASQAVLLALHGGASSCPGFYKIVERLNILRSSSKAPHLHIQPAGGDEESLSLAQEHSDGLDNGMYAGLSACLRHGGAENLKAGLVWLSRRLSGEDCAAPLPVPSPKEGIYHPDLGIFQDLQSYAKQRLEAGKPCVGILFFHTYMQNSNLAHVDALIREVESQGACPLAVFSLRLKDEKLGNLGAREVARRYFYLDGKPRIDVLINLMSMSMTMTSPDCVEVLPDLNVACLQALTPSCPYEVWLSGHQGLPTFDVTFQAAQPEFDGALICLPVASREESQTDPLTGALLPRFEPISERIAALTRLALNWAKLKRKENRQKRVAIVFHNYPPRNDRIGCAAGLDSFASVASLLKRLQNEGYVLEREYAMPDDLSGELLGGLTCDRTWLTPEELAVRAKASAGPEQYAPLFDELPTAVRQELTQSWGTPPGELFSNQGRLFFPGFINGNFFITIQPPRGKLENVSALLHKPDVPPPYHYISFYRYIRDEFKADAIIHVGKHGSLEWLPGKALGLSESCYPDICISDLPNIYPYIINDPSEGTQAKRRSYCCIVDHLTPSFDNAGLYEDLAGLENCLEDYAKAKQEDPSKLSILAEEAFKSACAADLDKDLSLDPGMLEHPEALIERLHAYLGELADTMIADGLHVLGAAPEGEALVKLMAQILRLQNPGVPSLREEILAFWGYEPESLLKARGREVAPSLRASQVIAKAQDTAESMLRELKKCGFDSAAVNEIAAKSLGKPSPEVLKALSYAALSLAPNIAKANEEIEACVNALSGGFVLPGASGALTRGQADILPTGRNFYSLDPRTIPSRAAYEVGKALGDALLSRHLKYTGSYPASLAIVLWGGSTMRSKGDDVAEILYLMGLKPVWTSSGLVKGLEVIPSSELQRPRIDVSARISGFFRDAFPNLVELLDEGASLVAALCEPAEINHLRQHVLEDAAKLEEAGLTAESALRKASARLYGCPPGSYGAGVAELIESGQWKSKADLGEIFIRFSAHSYGKNLNGEYDPESYRRVLSRVEATVKNEDSREYDMLSCVDFYNYHGGLIAAASSVRGKDPASYSADSSDPRNVLVRSTAEEAKHVLRSRILNPKWIEGLKRHGYKGAGELSKVFDVIIGWDATANVVDDWMYERLAGKYALDEQLRDWFKKVNPHALRNILSKLLECAERGLWRPKPETNESLRQAYLEIEGDLEETSDLGGFEP